MQMSGLRLLRPYAVEDRSMVAVTHLALLGVKIQDAAFWVLECKQDMDSFLQIYPCAAQNGQPFFENNIHKNKRYLS